MSWIEISNTWSPVDQRVLAIDTCTDSNGLPVRIKYWMDGAVMHAMTTNSPNQTRYWQYNGTWSNDGGAPPIGCAHAAPKPAASFAFRGQTFPIRR